MDLEDRKEVDAVEKPKGEAEGKYTVMLAFFGDVPVTLVADVAALYNTRYPGCVALDGGHPICRKLGATMCLAIKRLSLNGGAMKAKQVFDRMAFQLSANLTPKGIDDYADMEAALEVVGPEASEAAFWAECDRLKAARKG